MNLILSLSSYAWSSLFGKDQRYENKGLMHVTKGLQLVNQRFRDRNQSVSEGTLQAAFLMSAIEVRRRSIY